MQQSHQLPNAFCADVGSAALPLYCLSSAQLEAWCAQQPAALQHWINAQQYRAAAGSCLLLPAADGLAGAVIGIGADTDPFSYAHAPQALPAGQWQLASSLSADATQALVLGWGLGSYRFAAYKKSDKAQPQLHIDARQHHETLAVLAACVRVRDLVNTPTEDMGPEQLQQVLQEIANQYHAQLDVIVGDALLTQNYPAIHAVGRASHRAPRLLHLRAGRAHANAPKLALVGKGVCFDTGGLNIKASAGMRNMKKDMGGAAHAIALTELILRCDLPVQLDVYIAAVENAIGPNALRPGEVIATRQGVSVEIDNTDAEGRLVLCDAITRACEDAPALLLDFATLTGAARIALGPDLPALYANDDELAQAWLQAGQDVHDALWRMPLWRPYMRYLHSSIADLSNAASTTHAGSVTAALYLQEFVKKQQTWAHVDVYSWNDSARAGRPAGGEAQGLRAAWQMLKQRFAQGS